MMARCFLCHRILWPWQKRELWPIHQGEGYEIAAAIHSTHILIQDREDAALTQKIRSQTRTLDRMGEAIRKHRMREARNSSIRSVPDPRSDPEAS